MRNYSDPNMEAQLADQPVTEQEVRLILERLGERESCLCPTATVGDIAEAVSLPPEDIGSLLIEIRKQQNPVFEASVDKPPIQAPIQPVYFSPISEKERQQLHYLIEKERYRDIVPKVVFAIFVLIALFALYLTFILFGWSGSR